MKYVSKIHVAIKPRLKTGLWLWIGYLIWWKKVTIVVDCKGKELIMAKCFIKHDINLYGKLSKVKTVDLLYPWDKLLFGIVRYRGSLIINQVSNAEVVQYGK